MARSSLPFFNVGKHLIGLYLGRARHLRLWGGRLLVIVLLWVYYLAQILFFGAKFTQIYSNKYGSRFKPKSGVEEVAWR